MGNLPQLFMRHPDITSLPPLALPESFGLHSHIEGTEEVWEELIEDAFGFRASFEKTIKNGGGYRPEYVLYISKDGRDIATTTAIENDKYPGEGWFRMVAVSQEAQGLGAGKMVALAALHSLAARGYKSALLSTDDNRIPAINLYLSLGFEPIYTHESHKRRWEEVFEKGCGKWKIKDSGKKNS